MSQPHLFLGVEHEKSAAASADQLTADGAVLESQLIPPVYVFIGHFAGPLLLSLPVVIHQFAERMQILAFQGIANFVAQFFDIMQVLGHRYVMDTAFVVLLLQYG